MDEPRYDADVSPKERTIPQGSCPFNTAHCLPTKATAKPKHQPPRCRKCLDKPLRSECEHGRKKSAVFCYISSLLSKRTDSNLTRAFLVCLMMQDLLRLALYLPLPQPPHSLPSHSIPNLVHTFPLLVLEAMLHPLGLGPSRVLVSCTTLCYISNSRLGLLVPLPIPYSHSTWP